MVVAKVAEEAEEVLPPPPLPHLKLPQLMLLPPLLLKPEISFSVKTSFSTLLRVDEVKVAVMVAVKVVAEAVAKDEGRAVVAEVARSVLLSKQALQRVGLLHLKPLLLHPRLPLRLVQLERYL